MRKFLFAIFLVFATSNLAAAQEMKMSPEVAAYIQMKDEMNEQIIRTFIFTVNKQNVQIAELKQQVAKLEKKEKRQKKIKTVLTAFSTSTVGAIILILLL